MNIRKIPFERLVFLDESGLNLAMSRSHAWVKRGTELIDRVPMNWGKDLTLMAMRLDGWVVLTTTDEKATKDRFVWCHHRSAWVPVSPDPRWQGTHPVVALLHGPQPRSRVVVATSEASLPSTEARTVRRQPARVGPVTPVEARTRVRWHRWFRDPRSPAATVSWLKTKLLPKLRYGDVIVMDNLKAHHDRRVHELCAALGIKVIYLPPYSPDFNPIESGWALQKQFVRRHAPRDKHALRRVAQRARYRVTRQHCRSWFEHCGDRGQTS